MGFDFMTPENPRKAFRIISFALVALSFLSCSATLPETGDVGPEPDRIFNVGYSVIDLQYQSGEEEKTVTVAVWYPTGETASPYNYGGPTNGNVAAYSEPSFDKGPYPLLVFSHGYGGSGLGAVFLTEALASHGWVVAAPDHNDSHSAVRIRTGHNPDYNRSELLKDAKEISNSGPEDRDAYMYRLDEMLLVLDHMLSAEPFVSLIDSEKVALGGHSFGGFTSLGLCGTLEERQDDRIKAILLFSTGAGGYLFTENELAKVNMPSMYLYGEREINQKRGSTTMAELADKLYRNFQPPEYLLEVKGGNHFTFNNQLWGKIWIPLLSGSEEQFEVIRKYSIAFLETYIAGNTEFIPVLAQQDHMLTGYWSDVN